MPRIDAKTTVCAVIGHPIGHSLSPELHNAAFEALDIPYVYVAHDVQPGQVACVLDGMRAMGYRGLSVTIPHKIEALDAVDEVDEIAQRIGCINTVVNEEGRLLGYNSDGLGALGALRAADADPKDKQLLVLGSGGAARAIAVTIARESPPAKMTILGIDLEELSQLADDVRQLGCCNVAASELTESNLREAADSAAIVTQCSPVGMYPNTNDTVFPKTFFSESMTVFDVVYNPRRTRFLKEAKAAGCRTVEGIEMFLGQAIVQFELWTGKQAPRDIMRKVLEQKL